MSTLHDYVQDVVKKGNEGSDLLRAICAPTLKNCGLIDVIENIGPVLRIPEDQCVVVHSTGGEPELEDLSKHAESMVENLMLEAKLYGTSPIAFANVIDSNSGDADMLETIARALVHQANEHGLAIMNGENAILGDRVSADAQAIVSGTMISVVEKSKINLENVPFVLRYGATPYYVFDPAGKVVYINSDGVGTKTEFYERSGNYELALYDFSAMNLDDLVKIGATASVVSGVVEIRAKRDVNYLNICDEEDQMSVSTMTGVAHIFEKTLVDDRIKGYKEGVPSYNISGSAVSVIDEERLKNPLVARIGDQIVAIRGHANPRSNGITSKRKLMIEHFGENWHETEKGKEFLEYLASPSVILYPVFKELIDAGLATSVYHMSGGAYNGKFARPLAKLGLLGELDGMFPPHDMDLRFLEWSGADVRAAYSQWPMGNDGFITTPSPEEAIKVIERHGLGAKLAGAVGKGTESAGLSIKSPLGDSNQNTIYFSGKD